MRWIRLITLSLIGWYLLLCTLHLFNQRPLWNDEACVFISIRDFTPAQIFSQPLSNVQQFPRVYIYLIQQLSQPFDFSNLFLRLLPFIFMLGAFFVWVRLSVQGFAQDYQRMIFIACWCASLPLIYYCAELKQYSMDVFSSGLFLLFVSQQAKMQEKKPTAYLWALFLLPLLGLFSYTVILMLIFPFFNMFRLKNSRKVFLIYSLSCAAVLFLVYWFDVRIGNGAALKLYWREYFISFDSVGEFLRTFTEGVNNLISRWFAETPRWIRMAARFFLAFGLWQMIAGFMAQFKRDQYMFTSVGTVALVVFIELFLLGVFQVYAFSVVRTSLFFAPMILFLTVLGIEGLKRWNFSVGCAVYGVFFCFLMYVSLGIAGEIFKGDLGAQSIIWGMR